VRICSGHHSHPTDIFQEASYAVPSRQHFPYSSHACSVLRSALRGCPKRQRRSCSRHRHRSVRRSHSRCDRSSQQRIQRSQSHCNLRRHRPIRLLQCPFNPYQVTATANGFAVSSQSLEIRSVVGTNLKLVLQIETSATTVTVEATGDLVETDPTFHTDVDRDLFNKVPMESESSSLSSWLRKPLPALRPTPTAFSMASAITRPTRFQWTASPSPTAEQGLLQPDSGQLDSIHRGHLWRATGRIRRQNQPGNCCHHALRPGRNQAHGQHQQLLRRLRLGWCWLRPGLRRHKMGQLCRSRRHELRTLSRSP